MLGNFNEMLAMLGLTSLEEFVDNIMDNPTNYIIVVNKITNKGKNRTFKSKSSRKRVLHKQVQLNSFNLFGEY